jgi:hypothetical protein
LIYEQAGHVALLNRLNCAASRQVHDKRDHEQDQEDHEEQLGNTGCSNRDAGKSKNPGNQSDDQEN